ncbi:MAG: ribonuclease R [Bacteroidota bacterium]
MKKNNIDKLKRSIQKVFDGNSKKILNPRQIASMLGIESTEGRNEVIIALKLLVKDEALEEVSPGKYITVFKHKFIEGKVEMTQRGSAYVIPDEGGEDIMITPEFLNTALNRDRVKVNLFAQRGEKRSGEIVEVLERNKMEFVGVIQVAYNHAFVVADDKKMYTDIFIPLDKINKAKNGDKVIAKITEWTLEHKSPIGEVIEVIGRPGYHETEMHAIVAEFGFSFKFSEEVENEANKIPDKITKEEISNRRDFRKITTFTIDPDDAKDFDDALSIQKLEDGIWEIGVHIADVSHYVKPGTILDEEALERGTSVYLVDRTIPMLPEKLSNGLCSLRPHEEKLTFSVVFKMNENAELLDVWYGKTIIYSDRRFSYEEAQERIETGKGDFAEEIKKLNELALKLRSERFKNGAVNFETEEVKFILDENFKPVSVYKKVRKDAHKLIEEFMLLANKKVAEYGHNSKKGTPRTFVYRVHDLPNEEKLKLFSVFASRFGYIIRTQSQRAISQSMNELLAKVEGKPEQNLLQQQAIRTMSKAFYTTKKTGHYGLAFDFYSHFTSPIRRYPDLMAHRLLFEYLNNGKSANAEKYEVMCKHSSETETRAAEAERASVRYKQVEYIKDFIGEEFQGIISGVTEWGIYVEITEYKCEGMIRLSNMADDFYEYDEHNLCIVGRRTRKKYQLGDIVEVVVKEADVLKRQVNLDMAGNVITSRNLRRAEPNRKDRRRNEKKSNQKSKKKGRR